MQIHRLCRGMLLTLGASLSTLAFAQGNSVLFGTVTDAASGKKLADAVVTVTSSALISPQTVVSDSSGYYRIPGLPPGVYTVRIEKDGYRAYSRSELNLKLDRQYRVNIAAQPESMSSEEIKITVLPPVIDTASASQGIVADRQYIDKLPIVDSLGFDPGILIASTVPQTQSGPDGVGMSGASGLENLLQVDGVTTRNNQTGGNSGTTPSAFLNQINVSTGGFQAEIGRTTGGVIQSVTRSGSNEFHGEVLANYTPGGMLPMPKSIRSKNSPYASQNILWNAVDVSATLGGPILKDRIWFFAGLQVARTRTQNREWLQALKLNAAGDDYLYGGSLGIQYTDIDGTRQTNFTDNLRLPFIAKLTILLAKNQTLTFSTNGIYQTSKTPNQLRPTGPIDAVQWNGGALRPEVKNSLLLQYQGSFLDQKILMQAQVSWYRTSSWTEYSDGSTLDNSPRGSATGTPQVGLINNQYGMPLSFVDIPWLTSRYDAATKARIASACQPSFTTNKIIERCPLTTMGGVPVGGAGYLSTAVNDTVQANASITYLLAFLGHHIWKAGIDYEYNLSQITKGFSGGRQYFDGIMIGRPDSYLLNAAYGYQTGPDQMSSVKYFTNTSSSHQIAWYLQDTWSIMDKVTLNAGIRYDNQQMYDKLGELGLTLNNQISPRISLIWDPSQQGRSKIFASYGRYFESLPLSIVESRLNGDPAMRSPTSSSKNGGCDPLRNFASVYTSCAGYSDQNVNNAYNSPELLSRKYGFAGTNVASVDPNLKPQSSDEVSAGAEYEIFRNARLSASYTRRWINDVIEDLSVDEGKTFIISNPGSGLAASFPKAVRNYNAVTAQFSKFFESGWMTQASYTWINLTGNYEGLANSLQFGTPNTTIAFDQRELLVNASGRLPADTTHSIKIFGGKDFQVSNRWSLALFLSYRGMSGLPLSYMGSSPRYYGAVFILPRGTAGESPWTHSLDLSLSAGVSLGAGMKLHFRIDGINILNLEGVSRLNEVLVNNTPVLPMNIPKGANPQLAACLAGINQVGCSADTLPIRKYSDGSPLPRSELNKDFKQPTALGSPFTARFSIRLTF